MSRRTQLVFVWMGPAISVMLLVAMIPLAQLLPAPHADDTGEEIARQYQEHLSGIRFGMVVYMAAMALIAPWGAFIAAKTRRIEDNTPVYTYAQLGCVGAATTIGVLCPLIWVVAAFRANDLDPDTTRMINDFGWFAFLFDFTPFSAWCFLIATAIFTNKSGHEFLPRWVAYLNLWCGFLLLPAFCIAFFKDGPLAFHGVIALYIPLAAFLAWMVGMTVALFGVVNRDAPPKVESRSERQPAVLT